jgi:hypothetical protein
MATTSVLRIAWICALMGCGRIGFERPQGDDPLSPSACGQVVPVYPAHAGWGQHVARTAVDRDDDHQPEIDCVGRGLPCIHGGERRKLALSDVTTCDGIAASDALGAFRWRCAVDEGTTVLHATALPAGLSSLVDAIGWRDNHVTVTLDGRTLCASSPARWWQTPVQPLPVSDTAVVELVTPDIVYVADSSRTTRGHVIAAPRVAIVALDGATLSYDAGGGLSCNTTTGRATAADAHCAISVAADFAWVEGRIDGRNADSKLRGVQLRSTRSTHLVGLDVRATGAPGLDIADAYDLHVADVDQQGATAAAGISLDRVAWSRFERVRAANNALEGILVHGDFGVRSLLTSSFNTFSEIVVAGNTTSGIALTCGAHQNVVSQAITAGNGATGIHLICNRGNTLAHITAVSNGSDGVHFDMDGIRRASQLVAAGNLGDGLRVDSGSHDNVIVNLTATDNGVAGVHLDAVRTRFDGFLAVGENSALNCKVDGGEQPGLLDQTCSDTGADGSNSYGGEISSAVLRTARSVFDAFVGQSGTSASVTDWWAVGGRSRTWVRDGAFSSSAQHGRCTGPCRLWDWTTTPAGSLHDRSGNAVSPNDPVVPGGPCPTAVSGDVVGTLGERREVRGDGSGDDDGFCETDEPCHPLATYLINAVEFLGDGIGDDDALCNSNEACRYTPHPGAAITATPAIATCVFADGAVRGVMMFVP